RDFFSITFVAHPHSRWFIVSHVLRAQLTEVINKKTPCSDTALNKGDGRNFSLQTKGYVCYVINFMLLI
ncbi:hypothetical protein, partial [Staphylococcus felis]|uniref:hypothetical protein n=1 Tax=Staphylococcus felis TaxID=46127 RepID=UPI00197DA7DA